METALDGEEDWCQALFQSIKEEEWIVMEKLQQRVAGQSQVAWRKTSQESFFSVQVEQERAFNRRSAWRGSLLSILEGGHISSFEAV